MMTGFILGYMTLLSMLATASPGAGPLGWMLLFLPHQFLDFLHAPAYCLLAWLGIAGFSRRGWSAPYALAAGSLVALVFGIWTETLQGTVPGRGPEVKDVVTDTIGIAVAGYVVLRHSGFFTNASRTITQRSHTIGAGHA